ncbi:MAG: RluA family pseudouridine synthase [Sphingomonadaceae bacterium]|nr:RluA family pseudouridine synthase [Sphingomonadaceae bacterium]
MIEVRTLTISAEDDGARLDRWFERHVPEFGRVAVQRLCRTGQVRVDGSRAAPDTRVRVGQQVRVPPFRGDAPAAKMRRPVSPEDAALAENMVIHRDAQSLVLNKPAGLATQGGTGIHRSVDGLLDALIFDGTSRPKLVHRLDKDTSGALLLARTVRAAAFFSKAFSGRTARKVYWALVVGVPKRDRGVIALALSKQPGSGGEKMHPDPQGLPARTRYRVIDRAGNRAAFVEFQPLTGRTHQIRVHAAALGHPIVGDGKYGGTEAFLTGGVSRKLHLHARRLVIDHPDGTPLDVRADLPDHFAGSLDLLGFSASDGDALPIEDVKFYDTPEGRAKAEAAQAKTRRKARRGERRARGAR